MKLSEFVDMSRWEICDYTHLVVFHCNEIENPSVSNFQSYLSINYFCPRCGEPIIWGLCFDDVMHEPSCWMDCDCNVVDMRQVRQDVCAACNQKVWDAAEQAWIDPLEPTTDDDLWWWDWAQAQNNLE